MKRIISILILIIFLIFIYGSYINIKGYKVNEYFIESDKIKESYEELKFLHFSDILYKSTTTKEDVENIVDGIKKENADVIFFTGGLFSKQHKPSNDDIEDLKNMLKSIEATQYKFAIIGNDDEKYIDEYKEIMGYANFILLDNSNYLLFYKDIIPINIIGINDINKYEEISSVVSTSYTIVLTHKPDNFSALKNKDVDLVLAGHSLNGQIRLPFYGGLLKRNGCKEYIDGHYQVDNKELYVTNGFGTIKYNFRLFNKPSFNIYRLKNSTTK